MGDTRIALGKWDRVLSSTDQALSSAVVSKDRIDYEVSRRRGPNADMLELDRNRNLLLLQEANTVRGCPSNGRLRSSDTPP